MPDGILHGKPNGLARGLLRTVLLVFASSLAIGCKTPVSVAPTEINPHSSTAAWAYESLNDASDEALDWKQLANDGLHSNPASEAMRVLDQMVAIEATALPLSDLFEGLARQLSIDWQASEPLNAEVTWTLPKQPARQVLNELANQYDLAWTLSDGVLQVQGPKPYAAFYPIDYLNLERAFSSHVGLATQVGTMRGVDASNAQSSANSSSTTIDNQSKQQFWQSLSIDLELWLTAENSDARWSINQDTGLISLLASPNTHRRLAQYLKHTAAASQRQVLIEASVVEVLLSDEFEAGIDWQLLARSLDGVSAIQQLHGLGPLNSDNIGLAPTPSGLVSFSQRFGQGDFSATFQLLEQFGEARIVSRPQILAMNNQPAVLKVVNNRVYFTVNVERQQSADVSERFTQTQIHTVPVGLVMNVTPHISADNTVMLNVRPSLSRILGFVEDPNPDLNGSNVTNGVPEIQVREMESVLRLSSGSIAVIGGLMQSVQDDSDRNLPGLGGIPAIGALFGQQKRQRKRTELFIVIKPTVVETHSDAVSTRSLL